MNLNIIQTNNATHDLILSITKICGTPNKQTHRKSEETIEYKLTIPNETLSFKPFFFLAWILIG